MVWEVCNLVRTEDGLKKFERDVFVSDEDKAKREYIKQNPKILGVFVKIYKGLCPRCGSSARTRVVHNHKIEISQFCERCQVMANKLMEDAKK